jgi:hypothetical protein
MSIGTVQVQVVLPASADTEPDDLTVLICLPTAPPIQNG